MSLAESQGFIMWPRCVRTFFPLFPNLPVLDWRLATPGFIFGQHAQATTRRPLLIGTDSLSGKIQPSPPGAIGPAVGGNLLSADAGRQGGKKRGGGEMKGGARMKEGHTLMRLITGVSAAKAPNNGPCVCTCDVSSQIRRFWPALPAHAPWLLPLLLLFLHFLFVFALGGLCPDERQSR